MALVVNNPPANAGDNKRRVFDPWVRKIPGEGNGHSNNLAWKIPLMEEPGAGYSP